jgi:hypothetical protein
MLEEEEVQPVAQPVLAEVAVEEQVLSEQVMQLLELPIEVVVVVALGIILIHRELVFRVLEVPV